MALPQHPGGRECKKERKVTLADFILAQMAIWDLVVLTHAPIGCGLMLTASMGSLLHHAILQITALRPRKTSLDLSNTVVKSG